MSETILVVDDEENIRHTLRGVLADEGYDVLEAPDGRRALELLEHTAPRLAIVDVWMPEVDGIELVERMRAQAPGIPVIVISGHGSIETAVRVIRLGAFDFLEKPFPLDALLNVVGRALANGERVGTTLVDQMILAAPSIAPARSFPQRTIGRSVLVNGQGLHSGARTGLILQPLPPGSGIVFGSILSGETVPALVDYVESTGYATTLVRGGMVAKTVEHLMATLHAYGVTNLLVKMQAEVPILDGSALELCALLDEAGVVDQPATMEELVVDQRYAVGGSDPSEKGIAIEPADGFEVHYTLDYPAPIGRQDVTFRLTDAEAFRREIAPARTFGFVKEIEQLEQMGLAAGGRLNNCILVADEGVVNAPLRFADEFARHKVLDVLGDCYLLGRPIRGRIVARMTGHSDNAALLRVLRARFGVPALTGA
ncbi:MAG TPA: UDP-3-O-acyl-N-acetylglucosamine deacetylase [Candidatus Binatia bacterium]|nr:UDP-3-O-acyl-N-acetylglucosamine deacetylase [Candidatus Binatia bacterium]